MSATREVGGAVGAPPPDLSEEQRQVVVFRQGVLLVDAGPGSGKTRTVAARVAHLLRSGVPQEQILCVTFSRPARAEMRERIKLVAGAVPMVESFHSLALKLLKDHQRATPGKAPFTVIDERQQRAAVWAAANAEKVSDEDVVKRVMSAITAAKSRGEATAAEFRPPPELSPDFADLTRRIWGRYEQWCLTGLKERGLDFDDMLLEAAEALRSDAAFRARAHAEWRHVLVDEFQDSNAVQYATVRMIVEDRPSRGVGERYDCPLDGDRSLMVVADCDQAIYGFRGGVPGIVVNFAGDYPHCRVIPLGANYRSSGNIVRAAAGVIANNRERTRKELTPTHGEGPKVRVWAFDSAEREADYVAARCADLWRDKAGAQSVAVLTRYREQHDPLMQALRRRGVPAVRDKGVTLARTQEIAQLRALLRLAVAPHDDRAVVELLSSSARGEVSRARSEAQACGLSLWEALAFSEDDHVKSMRRSSGQIRDALRDGRVARAFALAFNHTGWFERLMEDARGEAQDRLRALGRVVAGVSALAAVGKLHSLSDLFAVLEERTPPVRVITAHSAKGLEWDWVFVCGADEERWRILDEKEAEEERRLFYVAMTRARKGLFVGHLKDCPVRFVGEIPDGHAERQEITGEGD